MPDPHRHFLPWDRPALAQAAELLVDHYGDAGAARMDGAVVVLPGARAGRRLKELLVEVAEERGVRLVPPRVVTMGVLPDLLHDPGRPAASPAVLRLAWSRALRETPPARLETVFLRRPADDALLEWATLGREMASLARAVGRGGYRFRQVARRCAAAPFFDDTERWEVLAGVQERMEALLDGLGMVDRDLARMEALDGGTVTLDGDLWLVGIAEMPRVLRRMVEACGGRVRALVHAPEERAGDFDALGCVRVEAWSRAHLPLDEERVTLADRPADQAVEVARILAGLEGGRAAEEITLGVPDPEVVPFLEQRLGRSGVPVRDAAGTPVSAAGPHRLLAAVGAFLEDRRYEALAALVRHPDLAPWLGQGSHGADGIDGGDGAEPPSPLDAWLTPLDEWHERHLPARMVAPYAGRGPRKEAVEALMERLDTGLLAPLGGARPLSEWVEPILTLLARIYAPHGLREASLRDRRLARALSEVRWAAESFARLPEALDTPCAASPALRLVLDQAASARIPPEADDAAVEMLGWLELHLDDAPVAVLTGVNEGALPESVRGHPFLPNALCAHLGLEDNGLRHARDVYRLAAMLHAREELHLVVGRRTADGDPLRPSRLLFQADDATVARRVCRFYGVRDGGDGGEAGGEQAAGRSDTPPSSAFVLPPEAEIPVEPLLERLRVTDFGAALADPYSWALRRVRRLEPLTDHAREMDGRLFGGLAHDVLEAFGRSDAVHETDPEAVARVLDDLLDRDVARRFGRQARVTVHLQVEQLRARLRAFAAWHAGRMADGWRVVAVEASTPEGGVPFEVDGRPVGLMARIDRVDHHPGRDAWAVFDYKTGDSGQDPDRVHRKGRKEKEWVDLQLPLYRWLVTRMPTEDGGFLVPPGAATVELGYLLLPRDLSEVGAAMAEWTDDEIEGGIERAREVVRALRAGPVAFDPERRPPFADEPLEALLGRGVLLPADDEDEEAA